MGGDLTLVQPLIPACYVKYFQSEIVGVAETKRNSLVSTVFGPSDGQEVHGVVPVVQPRHLQQKTRAKFEFVITE